MEDSIHSLKSLFDQLGIESTKDNINVFIHDNQPIPPNIKLHEANIWNNSQADFLNEAKELDADWAEIVDQLDALLR